MAPQLVDEYDAMSSCLSPYHWTNDMKKYYNQDWGNEHNFIVAKLQRSMAKFPKLWQVSDKDLYKGFARNGKNIQCRRCFNFGHKLQNCTEAQQLTCNMCGEKDHTPKWCPRRSCLTCGKRTRAFLAACGSCQQQRGVTCPRCLAVGHSLLDCTDHWRRYHVTTTDLPPTPPGATVNKPWEQIWCCNCGTKGHEAFACEKRERRDFQYPFPFVFSYESSFNSEAVHSKPPGEQGRPKQWKRYFEAPAGGAAPAVPPHEDVADVNIVASTSKIWFGSANTPVSQNPMPSPSQRKNRMCNQNRSRNASATTNRWFGDIGETSVASAATPSTRFSDTSTFYNGRQVKRKARDRFPQSPDTPDTPTAKRQKRKRRNLELDTYPTGKKRIAWWQHKKKDKNFNRMRRALGDQRYDPGSL